jgi:hypothetical protein
MSEHLTLFVSFDCMNIFVEEGRPKIIDNMSGIGLQRNKNKTNQNECGNKTQKKTIQNRHQYTSFT